jgi:hypothetical protein
MVHAVLVALPLSGYLSLASTKIHVPQFIWPPIGSIVEYAAGSRLYSLESLEDYLPALKRWPPGIDGPCGGCLFLSLRCSFTGIFS